MSRNAAMENAIKQGEQKGFGPFKVEFISVAHSIVDGIGLVIDTPEGIIIHSGDFKIDQTPVDGQMTDLVRFAHYGQKQPLILLSDSTNVEREGMTLSEREVRGTMEELFHGCRGRLIVAVFASNITRIQQIINLALKFGRKVHFNGKNDVLSTKIGAFLY